MPTHQRMQRRQWHLVQRESDWYVQSTCSLKVTVLRLSVKWLYPKQKDREEKHFPSFCRCSVETLKEFMRQCMVFRWQFAIWIHPCTNSCQQALMILHSWLRIWILIWMSLRALFPDYMNLTRWWVIADAVSLFLIRKSLKCRQQL